MRDIVLTLIVFGCLPFIMRNAYIGIYVWSWLSYMNPQRLTWGFAYFMPFAQIVAITLFAAILLSSEKKALPKEATVYVWFAYIAWMLVTTVFALRPEAAWPSFNTVFKIQLVTVLTMLLITDQKRIDGLIWVIVMSIGYYSVKGGIFTILTGGQYRVWGPEYSFIYENNALALSSLVIVPLAFYLHAIVHKPLYKWGMRLFMFFSVVSVFGSQSRGALVAMIAVAGFFWLKSRTKVLSAIAIVLVAIISLSVMSDFWFDRMDTLRNYEEDASAMSRFNSWTYNWNLANDRFSGGGLTSESSWTFALYAPDPTDVHAAHSIFFGVLGDHGWPGLLLFLLILFLTWRNLDYVIRATAGNKFESDDKKNLLARMLQVSLVAYASGGAFLSLAYFDLPWHVIAISILLKDQLGQRKRVSEMPSEEGTSANQPFPEPGLVQRIGSARV